MHVLLYELAHLGRWRRRLGDLRDQIRGRRFSYAVDEDAHEGDSEKHEEEDGEAVEDAGAVVEPLFLLFGGVADAGEVGVEL